jgi:hypothetical protein
MARLVANKPPPFELLEAKRNAKPVSPGVEVLVGLGKVVFGIQLISVPLEAVVTI